MNPARISIALTLVLYVLACGSAGAVEYVIRVENDFGKPAAGFVVGGIAPDQCLLPVTTNARGTATIKSANPLVGIVVADPKFKHSPTFIRMNRASTRYVVRATRETMNRQRAEAILNRAMDLLAATGDLADLGAKIASGASGIVVGVPGVFSLTPVVRGGNIYFQATGTVADMISRFLPPEIRTSYGYVSM